MRLAQYGLGCYLTVDGYSRTTFNSYSAIREIKIKNNYTFGITYNNTLIIRMIYYDYSSTTHQMFFETRASYDSVIENFVGLTIHEAVVLAAVKIRSRRHVPAVDAIIRRVIG